VTGMEPPRDHDREPDRDHDRDPGAQQPYTEAFWREFLTHGSASERYLRRLLKHFPSDPRCRLCAAPFRGMGAPLMRAIGKRPSDGNPNLCNTCITFLAQHHGGAEVTGSALFADVRGSTSIAEAISPSAYRDLMDRFYSTASAVVVAHDGIIDKFVGDELVAFFFPLLTGERYAERAVSAARALLEATGHRDPAGPWVPLGAGVTSGTVWFGAVGTGTHTELTALGDQVNVAARLASVAGAGEILVTTEAARASGLGVDAPALRHLDLKGKHEQTDVVVLSIAPPGRASAP